MFMPNEDEIRAAFFAAQPSLSLVEVQALTMQAKLKVMLNKLSIEEAVKSLL